MTEQQYRRREKRAMAKWRKEQQAQWWRKFFNFPTERKPLRTSGSK